MFALHGVQELDVYLKCLALGDAAEHIAYNWFKSSASDSTASEIEWVSQTTNNAGFDFCVSSELVFRSEELSCRHKLCRVEVKGFSAKESEPSDFFISRNEYDVMLKSKSQGFEFVILLVSVGPQDGCGVVHSMLEKDALLHVDVQSRWSQAQILLSEIPITNKQLIAARIQSHDS